MKCSPPASNLNETVGGTGRHECDQEVALCRLTRTTMSLNELTVKREQPTQDGAAKI